MRSVPLPNRNCCFADCHISLPLKSVTLHGYSFTGRTTQLGLNIYDVRWRFLKGCVSVIRLRTGLLHAIAWDCSGCYVGNSFANLVCVSVNDTVVRLYRHHSRTRR